MNPITKSSKQNTPIQVSVVIPAYNAQKYLEQTVKSVMGQTMTAWECIIVDDGSSDGTAALARELAAGDARIRLVQQENAGVSAARNLGLEKSDAGTPFVAFLDADDLWDARFLETLMNVLQNHPEVVGCHSNAFYIDGDGQSIHEGVLENTMRERFFFNGRGISHMQGDESTTFAAAITNCPIITTGCVLMRREACEKIGGFDDTLRQGEDWDVWIRLTCLSDLIFVDQALLAYRRHQNNASVDRRTAVAQVQMVRRKAIENPQNTPEQKRMACKVYRAFYWHMAQRRYRAIWGHTKKLATKAAAQNLGLALVNTAMALKGRP